MTVERGYPNGIWSVVYFFDAFDRGRFADLLRDALPEILPLPKRSDFVEFEFDETRTDDFQSDPPYWMRFCDPNDFLALVILVGRGEVKDKDDGETVPLPSFVASVAADLRAILAHDARAGGQTTLRLCIWRD